MGILLLTFCSDPASPKKPVNYIQGSTYYGGDIKMQLTVPSNWTMTIDTVAGGIQFLVIGRKTVYTSIQPNFNMMASIHSGTSDMNEILNQAQSIILGSLQNPSVISKQTVQLDNKNCGAIEFTATMYGLQVWGRQLYIINNGKDIILTFSDDSAYYQTDLADFDTIQNSIRFMD
jgi:hypothetical protein